MSDNTFTLSEMREAFKKKMEGKPLTPKEQELAQARQAAIRAGLENEVDYNADGSLPEPDKFWEP